MLINDFTRHGEIKDIHAFEQLKKIGLPTKKTEEFRQFDISDMLAKDFLLNSGKVRFSDDFKYLLNQDFFTLFVFGGEVDIANSVLPKSVIYYKKEKITHESPNALYYLSEAYTEQANEITIEADLEKPLMIINIYEGEDLFIPTSLIVTVKENCKVDIVEACVSSHLRNSFVNANKTFILKENAALGYTKLQSADPGNRFISNIEPVLFKNARCALVAIELDSDRSLNIINSTLSHKYATFSFESIVKLKADNRSGNIVSIVHDAEFTESNMMCKHLLDDTSHALFEVKTTVNHEAKFSKTFQNSQTILLKDGARINANPKLILHTDELEAAHGATSGSLDDEALYYMQSRGIKMEKAKKMLINAIELQVIEKIGNESVQKLALSFIGE